MCFVCVCVLIWGVGGGGGLRTRACCAHDRYWKDVFSVVCHFSNLAHLSISLTSFCQMARFECNIVASYNIKTKKTKP